MRLKRREPADLIRYAESQFEWETRILVLQAAAILRIRPDGILGDGLPNHLYDGALESWLIHLRLLDDFLRHRQGGKGDPVIARHWHPGWKSHGFLDEPTRRALNDQLAHLDWRRVRWGETRPPWEGRFCEITDACCDELIKFFDSVPGDIQHGFDQSRTNIAWWLDRTWQKEEALADCIRELEDCVRSTAL